MNRRAYGTRVKRRRAKAERRKRKEASLVKWYMTLVAIPQRLQRQRKP